MQPLCSLRLCEKKITLREIMLPCLPFGMLHANANRFMNFCNLRTYRSCLENPQKCRRHRADILHDRVVRRHYGRWVGNSPYSKLKNSCLSPMSICCQTALIYIPSSALAILFLTKCRLHEQSVVKNCYLYPVLAIYDLSS